MENNEKKDWILCPKCGSKTRTQIRTHTVLEDFPLFCPKCRYECVVSYHDGKMEEQKNVKNRAFDKKIRREKGSG